jgi:hypothetical protein
MEELLIMDSQKMENSSNPTMHRKPYQTPGRLMVLGAIDSVVLSSTHAGTDGGGHTTTANS